MTESGNSNEIRRVVLLGAGNLAWHLGYHFRKADIDILQVFNRHRESGEKLASELKATFTNRLDSLNGDADLYVLAITDDAIDGILEEGWFRQGKMVVHVAGSISMEVFEGRAVNYGVFYPLQTFTKGVAVDFSQIPVFIEANNAENLIKLEILAQRISEDVHRINSESRMLLHLAAVLTSNFTNHLFTIAEELLRDKGIAFDVLKPLIRETMNKVMNMPPNKAQTGPAVRGNHAVIEKHLQMLGHYPQVREIYALISKSITTWKNGPL